MIEMNNVVVLHLGAVKHISDQARVFRNLDADRVFDCPHRGQSMNQRSDAAGSCDKMLRVTRIPPLKDELDTPEHLP